MKIAGGLQEDGVVVGNAYDKYGSKNPVARWLMAGFDKSLSELVAFTQPLKIHEIGCGEGYWVLEWRRRGLNASGSDFSMQVIDLARENAVEKQLSPDIFKQRSIYDLDPEKDRADLIVCCEVLEHLESPAKGLQALQGVVEKYVILSVPREPVWCALNLMRGKYIPKLGNTPGHIQHWSRSGFVKLVAQYFDIITIKTPFPWTMLLCRINNQA